MRDNRRVVLSMLDEVGCRVSQVTNCDDGTSSLRFRVDGHLDRYVDVTDSAESDDRLVTCRTVRHVRASVAGSNGDVLALVRSGLSVLSAARLADLKVARETCDHSPPTGDAAFGQVRTCGCGAKTYRFGWGGPSHPSAWDLVGEGEEAE
jgi:hypothetical protein